MEDTIRLFRDTLFKNFYGWLEKNREAIGDKEYSALFSRAKEAENTADNAIGITAVALWMFNMTANCGVMAGIGPDGYNLQCLENPKLDEPSTKKLLTIIVACMNLQYLPAEIAKQQVPVIASEKFSLKLYVTQTKDLRFSPENGNRKP
jgi:hypothetical protein